MKNNFGLFSSLLSEVLWEICELLTDKYCNLMHFRGGLLRSRAVLYSKSIESAGIILDKCVGFKDCTKIRMTRSGGHQTLQRSVYYGHKCMH